MQLPNKQDMQLAAHGTHIPFSPHVSQGPQSETHCPLTQVLHSMQMIGAQEPSMHSEQGGHGSTQQSKPPPSGPSEWQHWPVTE